MAEKSLPFIETLKKFIKKSHFKWTKEAEAAFQEMKTHLCKLTTLVSPREKETLILYLVATPMAIIAVLMTEREGQECPV
jgi:UDP-N-acetylmuramyl pentapeptide phosphotransferase/UDP-N-acetylglucosamine-1-phosphate transferase